MEYCGCIYSVDDFCFMGWRGILLFKTFSYFCFIQVADRSEELKEKRERLKEWNAVKWNDVPEPGIK